jgi:hypothetical protein
MQVGICVFTFLYGRSINFYIKVYTNGLDLALYINTLIKRLLALFTNLFIKFTNTLVHIPLYR